MTPLLPPVEKPRHPMRKLSYLFTPSDANSSTTTEATVTRREGVACESR
jgi:hypothetical protein